MLVLNEHQYTTLGITCTILSYWQVKEAFKWALFNVEYVRLYGLNSVDDVDRLSYFLITIIIFLFM